MTLFTVLLAVLFGLCGTAAGEETAGCLLACTYDVSGGMENQSLSMTLFREDASGSVVLRVEERWGDEEKKAEYPVSPDAMDMLAGFMTPYEPWNWKDIPYSEIQALDAPLKRIALIFEDGTEYYISDDREISGFLFRETKSFMEACRTGDEASFSWTDELPDLENEPTGEETGETAPDMQ